MKATIQYHNEGSMATPFNIKSRVKQGCILPPKVFGIFFVLLLKLLEHQQRECTVTQDLTVHFQTGLTKSKNQLDSENHQEHAFCGCCCCHLTHHV